MHVPGEQEFIPFYCRITLQPFKSAWHTVGIQKIFAEWISSSLWIEEI